MEMTRWPLIEQAAVKTMITKNHLNKIVLYVVCTNDAIIAKLETYKANIEVRMVSHSLCQ